MRGRIISKALAFSLVIIICSCDDKRVFDSYQSTSNRWHKDSLIQFTFEAPDTIKPYNLFINLRNTHEYPFSNLYMITTLNFPYGKVLKDTIEYKMAAPNGELLGTGFSDIKENKLWYKGHERPFVFEEPGAYRIQIEHAMRENASVEGLVYLEGVTDVGLRIEQSN
jgi:gliding motility-associated lipoprotein GldH